MFKIKPRSTKRKSVAKLKKQAWQLCSRYIRLRDCMRTTGTLDYGNCITCTALIRYKEAHAGHFVRREHGATLFDETNVHLQCARCNCFGGGETLKYRREIIKLYGEGHDVLLEEKATEIKKFTIEELEELKRYFAVKIKDLTGLQ